MLACACWVAFASVLVAAYWVPFVRWADGWAVEGFLGLQRPGLDSIASRVAHLADPLPFALATAAIVGVALRRGLPRHALGALVLLVGASAITQYLKVMLQHERAHDFLGGAQLSSIAYPSGHATASMSLALAAVLVAPVWLRPIVALGGSLFALAVSESLLLLGWHFPSDVVGGFLVATASALLVLAGLRAADERWPERTGRQAAQRVLANGALVRVELLLIALIALAGAAAVVITGDRAFTYMDRHTTAVAATLVVATMAAALPVALSAVSVRRP